MTLLSGVRRSPRRRGRVPGARRGFSLIEILVAMTMLSIVLVSLARLATVVAVRGRTNALAAKRNAALQLEANKIGAMTYASLATWPTAAKIDTVNTFVYTRRLTLTKAASGSRYTVKIVVLPVTDTTTKDSVVFDRTLPATGSPLCVGC